MKQYLLMMVMLLVVSVVSLAPVAAVAVENQSASSVLEMVHLNKATAEELQQLPGVGPALSERIVIYRSEHGPFNDVGQLTEVKGVGDAKLAKFKSRLTID